MDKSIICICALFMASCAEPSQTNPNNQIIQISNLKEYPNYKVMIYTDELTGCQYIIFPSWGAVESTQVIPRMERTIGTGRAHRCIIKDAHE